MRNIPHHEDIDAAIEVLLTELESVEHPEPKVRRWIQEVIDAAYQVDSVDRPSEALNVVDRLAERLITYGEGKDRIVDEQLAMLGL